jgi:hypothetical protein
VRQSPPGGGVGGEGVSIVVSRCVATPSKDVEDLASAIVNCKMCELVKLLQLPVVTSYKSPINQIINPNPVSSH